MDGAERTVLRNVRVWDGMGKDYLSGVDAIRIEAGKIVAAGSADELGSGPLTRDLSGLTVLPGLIDCHVHLSIDPEIRSPTDQPSGEVVRDAMRGRVEAMVRAGITTARDLGGGEWIEIEMRNAIASADQLGPRLMCAGQPITSPGGHCHFWGGEAGDEAAALEVLTRQVEQQVDLIKIMATGGSLTPGSTPKDAQFDQAVVDAVVREAARHGLGVAAHCHGTEGIRHAAYAGVRTIEHCSWVGERGWGTDYDDAAVAEIAARGIFVSPTINSGWRRFKGSAEREAQVGSNFDRMQAAGVRFVASTDAGIPGVFHDDLPKALPHFSYFGHLGPVEVLRAATSNAADALGLGGVTGQIAPGFSADLMLVDGDPLEDLEVLATPAEVYCLGRAVALD